MNIRDAVSTLFAKPTEAPVTDPRNELKTSFWSSKRFLLVLAFGAVLVLNLIPDSKFHDASCVLIAYLLGESAVACIVAHGNAKIKQAEQHADIEYERIKAPSKP